MATGLGVFASVKERRILCFAFVIILPITISVEAQLPQTQPTDNSPVTSLPRFEVAVIRPVRPGDAGVTGIGLYPGGRLTIGHVTLKTLIGIAFRLSSWQISNANGWMEKDWFDVEGKPPESLASQLNLHHSVFGIEDAQLRQMLQALLIERFQLRFHRTTKTGPVYVLETNGKTLRMQRQKTRQEAKDASDTAGNVSFYAGEGWAFFNTSMTQLARFASDRIVDRPVVDHTGLTGNFDFSTNEPLTDQETQDAGFQASFFPFLAEAGLRLKPATGPVEMFIVDHAEQPSQN